MYNNALKCKFIVQWSLAQTGLCPRTSAEANKSYDSNIECI